MIRTTFQIFSIISILLIAFLFMWTDAQTSHVYHNHLTPLLIFIIFALFAFSLSLGNNEYEYYSDFSNSNHRIKVIIKEGYKTEFYPLVRIGTTNFWKHLSYDYGYGDQTLQALGSEEEALKLIKNNIKQTQTSFIAVN